jgi:hypothetical protein
VDCDLVLDERHGVLFLPLNLVGQKQFLTWTDGSSESFLGMLARLAWCYDRIVLILESYSPR